MILRFVDLQRTCDFLEKNIDFVISLRRVFTEGRSQEKTAAVFTLWARSVSIVIRWAGWGPVLLPTSLQPVQPSSCASVLVCPDLVRRNQRAVSV